MGEDKLAATRRMVGAEEQASQRVGINVAFEPHSGSPLDVQHDAVAIVTGRPHAFRAGLLGQSEKSPPVQAG